MKNFIMLLIVALLLAGMLLAPVDQGTAYADSDTDTDSEDVTEEINKDEGWESDEEEDEDEAQDDQTEASNASIITGPTIGNILLIHDNSVSDEDVRQMEDSASDLGIDVIDKIINFDLKYSGLDPDDVEVVDYIVVISRDVSGLDILVEYVTSEKLPLSTKVRLGLE